MKCVFISQGCRSCCSAVKLKSNSYVCEPFTLFCVAFVSCIALSSIKCYYIMLFVIKPFLETRNTRDKPPILKATTNCSAIYS